MRVSGARILGTPEEEKALHEAYTAYKKKFGYPYPMGIICSVDPNEIKDLVKKIYKRIKTNNPLPDPTEREAGRVY